MGLLDNILGNIGNSQPQVGQNLLPGMLSGMFGEDRQQGANMLALLMSLVQQMGGISSVLNMFRRQGLGRQADSWVGTGPNDKISGQQVENVFGSAQINGIASKLGITTEQACSGIAQLLPELINQFTPEGRIPENQNDLLLQAVSELRRTQE